MQLQHNQTLYGRLLEAIDNDWHLKARPNQLPPAEDWWTYWLILAGRSWGKTRSSAEWIRGLAESGAASHIALVGATAGDTRDILVEGRSGLLAIAPKSFRPIYEPSKRKLTWPNGAVATLFSAEEPDRLRGPEHDAAWCDELASWQNLQATWDNLQFGLRVGTRPRVVISTTPRPLPFLKELLKRDGKDVFVTRGNTYDNRANLAPSYLHEIASKYEGTRLGRQELNAEILEDTPGAMWSRDLIERTRSPQERDKPFRRIVVAIDPAVSVSENSDETGIIVVGLDAAGHGHVLEDASGKLAPAQWASIAIRLYHRYGADRVVAEVNQGGAMVESTLRMIDPAVAFKAVHASRGKVTRAEPVSALFEQGRAHLAGTFPALEDQMCTYTADGKGSPDRMDAMVWGFTELMVAANQKTGFLEFYKQLAEAKNKSDPDPEPVPEPAAIEDFSEVDVPGWTPRSKLKAANVAHNREVD